MSCSSTYHINLLNGLKMKNMFFIIEKCSPFTFKEPGTDCHQHLALLKHQTPFHYFEWGKWEGRMGWKVQTEVTATSESSGMIIMMLLLSLRMYAPLASLRVDRLPSRLLQASCAPSWCSRVRNWTLFTSDSESCEISSSWGWHNFCNLQFSLKWYVDD